MSESKPTPDFMATWPVEAQRTIKELHNALWLALKASDGEIVVTPEEMAEWGQPQGSIEWLTDPSSGIKIIRLADAE